ncbi:MAG: restriction endonuclease subunit S [Desulfobacteraceae bacterium]|nr:restriction endonuclease subunit S [Desulfobacteraceae bacterium]
MKTPLKKIASIQTGYSFRSRLDFLDKGPTAVIQMKDLSDENFVDCAKLMRVDMGRVKEHHLVKVGDIVFRSRGLVTTAAILTEDPGPAVVAAPLIKVCVDKTSVMPAFLVWYLNQPAAQAFFASRAKGTAQKMISKQALASFEVSVPLLEKQQAIVEAAALAEEEQRLLKQIAGRRLEYVSKRLMQSAQGE